MKTLTSKKPLYREHVHELTAACDNFVDAQWQFDKEKFARRHPPKKAQQDATNEQDQKSSNSENRYLKTFRYALERLKRSGDFKGFKKVTEVPAYIQDLANQGDVHLSQVKPEDYAWLVFCKLKCGVGSQFCQSSLAENSHPFLKLGGKLYQREFNNYESKNAEFEDWLEDLDDLASEFKDIKKQLARAAKKDFSELEDWGWDEVTDSYLVASFANEPDGRYQVRDFVPVDLEVKGPAQPKLNTLKYRIANYDYRQIYQATQELRQCLDLPEVSEDEKKQARNNVRTKLENYRDLASSTYDLMEQFEFFFPAEIWYCGIPLGIYGDCDDLFEYIETSVVPYLWRNIKPNYLLYRFVDAKGFAEITSAESTLVSFEKDNLPYLVFDSKVYRRQFATELTGCEQDQEQTFLTQLLFAPEQQVTATPALVADNFYASALISPAQVHNWLLQHGWKLVEDGESLPSEQVLSQVDGKPKMVTRSYGQQELELFRQLPDGRYQRPPFYLGDKLKQSEVAELASWVKEQLKYGEVETSDDPSDSTFAEYPLDKPVFFHGLTKQEVLDELCCHFESESFSSHDYRGFSLFDNSHPYAVLAGRLYQRIDTSEDDVAMVKAGEMVTPEAALCGWQMVFNFELAKYAAILPEGRYPKTLIGELYERNYQRVKELFVSRRWQEFEDLPLRAFLENQKLISPLSPIFGEDYDEVVDADGYSALWRTHSNVGMSQDLRQQVTSQVYKRLADDLSLVLAQRGITEYELFCDKTNDEVMGLLFADGACYEDTHLPFLVYKQHVLRRRTRKEGQVFNVRFQSDFSDYEFDLGDLDDLGWVELPTALARVFSWNLLPDGRYPALDSYCISEEFPESIARLIDESATSSRVPIYDKGDFGEEGEFLDDQIEKVYRQTRQGCWNALTKPTLYAAFNFYHDDDFEDNQEAILERLEKAGLSNQLQLNFTEDVKTLLALKLEERGKELQQKLNFYFSLTTLP